LKISL